MVLVISYLKNGTLPKDHNASRRPKVRSLRFVLVRDILQKGFLSFVPEMLSSR